MTGRQLVPPRPQARTLNARVAREALLPAWRRTNPGQHLNERRMDSRQRSRSRQQLAPPRAIPASCPSERSSATNRPAQASSAIVCSVSSASQIRHSRPADNRSSDSDTRSESAPHSSTTSSGKARSRSSTLRAHSRAASRTASLQLSNRAGGHCTPAGGDKTNRCTSARSRITSVSANRSGGQSSSSSVTAQPATPCQTDAIVGS